MRNYEEAQRTVDWEHPGLAMEASIFSCEGDGGHTGS